MTLGVEERGLLEKSIDYEIKKMNQTIMFGRDENSKKVLQIKNDSDFALGWALGSIISSFSHNMVERRNSILSQEDTDEAMDIVIKRVREIKEAIFKCG